LKLSQVIIGVTVGAPVMLQRIGKFGFVANPAIDSLMLSFKQKVCLAVIE
jgi:hypothetical protein